MIKKEYIETFLTVAETKSFSKTAEKIYVTQSAVTQRMDALEKTLGFPLLVRCNKGIQLTGQGEIFLEYAKDSRKKYFQMIERCQAAESRTLRIGCDFEDSTIFFPALIERYLQKYPDVKIEIIGHILTDAFERLLKNEFDICW
ncbi:MAG: LysR family transcriptional regulator, partial [Lachnospiraceae bacterium]|nr:LysR family transcriptional regulator [Lachnospiraceae bacterium]